MIFWLFTGVLVWVSFLFGEHTARTLAVGDLGIFPFLLPGLVLQAVGRGDELWFALPISRRSRFWKLFLRTLIVLTLAPLSWSIGMWWGLSGQTGHVEGLGSLAWGYAAFAAATAPTLWLKIRLDNPNPEWSWSYLLETAAFFLLVFSPWVWLGETLGTFQPVLITLGLLAVVVVSWAATARKFFLGDWLR